MRHMMRTSSLPGPVPVCLLAALALCLAAMLPAPAAASPRSRFSRAEINWATTWINTALPKFMQRGIIAKISTKNDTFQVYAGRSWYGLSFTQQGELLKNLAHAREIIGHYPTFTVIDSDTSETVARVSGPAIEIRIPGEGFKFYDPQFPAAAEPFGSYP